MIKNFLLLAFASTGIMATAQMPSILWQHVHGGSGSDYIQQVLATPDGGWIAVGYTASTNGDVTGHHGGFDGWLVKLDASGMISWQRVYGGTGDDVLSGICLSGDGGYIVSGNSTSNNGDLTENNGQKDAWVMKVNTTGSIVWQDVLGGALEDSFSRVTPTADGNFLCVGSSHTNLGGDPIPHYGALDGHVVKYGPTGSIIWQQIWGGGSDDEFWRVTATADGGCIVAGQSTTANLTGIITEPAHSNYQDVWVVKLDATGNITWQRMIGGTAVEQSFDLIITNDGQYLVVGHSSSSNGDLPLGQGVHDALLIKLSATGATQWVKTLGSSLMDAAYSVVQLTDGGYLFLGAARANDGDVSGHHGSADVWVVKTDGTGNLEWQGCLGGTGNDIGLTFQLAPDGGLFIVGLSNSSDGDVPEALGGGDMWVIKTGALEVGVAEHASKLFSIAPNPTSGPVRLFFSQPAGQVIVRVMDAQGQVVHTERTSSMNTAMDLSGEPAGTYFVEVLSEAGRQTHPLLILPAE